MMVTAHKHTLRALFDGFLLAKEADGVSKYTIGTYQVMFQNLVRDFPPEKLEEPSQLTSQDFQEWVVGLRQRVATATVDQRISKVKTFFNWCVAEGFLDDNPAKVLKRPKKNWQPDPLSSELPRSKLRGIGSLVPQLELYGILLMLMILDVTPNHIAGHFVTYGSHKVAVAPEFAAPQLPAQVGILAKQLSGRDAFQHLHDPGWRQPRRRFEEYVHMIFHHFQGVYDHLVFLGDSLKHIFGVVGNFWRQNLLAILRYPDKMVLEVVD
jgi:hypothetical protein